MTTTPPPPPLPLKTPRLLLRPLHEADRPEFIRVHELSWHSFSPWFPSPEPGETFNDLFNRHLERATKGAAEGTEYRFIAQLAPHTGDTQHPGTIAGFFNLFHIVRGAWQNATAGWAVNLEFANQGIGTEGVTALLDIAFAPPPQGLALHRVQANIIPTNLASAKVAQKAGFRNEGLAKRYLRINNQWQDHSMYAKLAEEHTPAYLHPQQPAQ